MGLDHGFYVGAYVWCSNRPVEKTRLGPACPRGCCKAGALESAKYCPACGAQIVQKPVPATGKAVDTGKVDSGLCDRLHRFGRHTSGAFEDFDVFVPNCAWPGSAKRKVNERFIGECSIGDSDPKDEKSSFEVAFRNELVHLRKAYGDENVRVRWGVLGEYA